MGAEQFHGEAPEKQSPEKQEISPEQLDSYLRAAETSAERAEKNTVESGEKAAEKARIEALEAAISVERGGAEKKRKAPSSSPAKRRHGVVSKKEREASYKHHMQQLQSELSPGQRAFSKFIHNPVVEKTSEAIGNTIARPNAVLAGAVVAFILVLAVYVIARFYGYTLSGFETIGAFIAGWLLGIMYDFFKVMITGKKA
jgi:hypothetical protein